MSCSAFRPADVSCTGHRTALAVEVSPPRALCGCAAAEVLRRGVQAAATGEAFLDAAKSVGAMLSRHALSAVSVWWVPNMVLGWTVFSVAAFAGLAAYFIAMATWQGGNRHDEDMVRLLCACHTCV